MTMFKIGDILSSPIANGGEVRYEVIEMDSDRYHMHVLNGAMEGSHRWYHKRSVHQACVIVARLPEPLKTHVFRRPQRMVEL